MPNQKNQAEWRRTMDNTPDLPGYQSLDGNTLAGGVERRSAHTRRNVAITLWLIGFIALVGASVIVLSHPAPWPFDLQTTITVQHLQLPSWVSTPIVWVSVVGQPPDPYFYIPASFVLLLLIGVFVWLRGGSPMPWFVTAIFLFVGEIVRLIVWFLLILMVARPRPSSPLIHVYMPENGFATFPSGHAMHDVVFYGFLLYVSLTKPISQWRYRWLLIPLQLYAALNILLIGYSRVYEGSHWLTDVLGGYLAGVLFLVPLIVLYRWTLDKLTKRHEKRLMQKAAQNQQA
jgi:membrane-associated phospholipid phosphatase